MKNKESSFGTNTNKSHQRRAVKLKKATSESGSNLKHIRNLDWAALINDLLRILALTQNELSEKCNVSQQSVSNWRAGVRRPGVFARHVLRELANNANLTLDTYLTKPKPKVTESSIEIPEDILAFSQRISLLPKRELEKK